MTPPNLLSEANALRAVAEANRPGIVLDFDGTLSEIVPTPDAAVIHPRAAAALSRAVESYALVAILSGRAVRDIAGRVAPHVATGRVTYVGNHGAEFIDGADGRLRVLSEPPEGIPRILEHLRSATCDIPGMVYEDKRFSASVHFRGAPNPDDAERRLRRASDDARAAVQGLEELRWFWGRMILEIRPRAAVNKGDAIAALAERHRLDAVIFIGDDTTDTDGMRRLPTLDGVKAIGVAVLSEETPPELLEVAQYTVDGVEEVADALEELVARRLVTSPPASPSSR